MDIFSQFSDPIPLVSNSTSINKLDPSSLSDASTSTSTSTARGNTHSDDEVLLASSHPKKRAGRRIFKETRHPIFRGVRRRNNNKWVCELREPNKKSRIWLGTYPTPEMAARAHDVAALAFRGKNACLNFADSAWRLPVPASKDAKDIRRAAAEAAETVRPLEVEEVSSGDARQERNTKLLEEVKTLQENVYVPEKGLFMDEEEFFDMPRLIEDMAEGLLLSPPPLVEDGMNWDTDVDSYSDVSLWSYSVDI